VKKMNELVTNNGLLDFDKADDVTEKEAKNYKTMVNKNAKEVSDGILKALLPKAPNAKVTEKNGTFLINADSGNIVQVEQCLPQKIKGATEFIPTIDIAITATGADIAPVIGALNAFFSNWRTVAGLIAVGAAFVGGMWVLTISRIEAS
jgi:hypothetical protein